jgi:16S rRNA (guanine966-N2)-methyltransferase
MASNEVRIIGGNWRGRKLVFPDRPDLRPTLGRVRETLFNWLRADVPGARCLDLFAGSGALGFEALSRGAREVTFVERDRRAAAALTANAKRLEAGERARILCDRAERVLRRCAEPWDVIFVDPPFRDADLAAVLDAVAGAGALAGEGLIYFEAPRRATLDLGAWRVVREGHAGDTRFGLLATP